MCRLYVILLSTCVRSTFVEIVWLCDVILFPPLSTFQFGIHENWCQIGMLRHPPTFPVVQMSTNSVTFLHCFIRWCRENAIGLFKFCQFDMRQYLTSPAHLPSEYPPAAPLLINHFLPTVCLPLSACVRGLGHISITSLHSVSPVSGIWVTQNISTILTYFTSYLIIESCWRTRCLPMSDSSALAFFFADAHLSPVFMAS